MSKNYIWSNQVDKTYECRVEQLKDPYKGILTVTYKEEVLLTKEVTINFGGPFGPDAGDVDEWCGICIKCADEHIAKLKAEAAQSKEQP